MIVTQKSMEIRKILIADDHDIVRLGTSMILKQAFPLTKIIQAKDFDEIMKILEEEIFDLMLLDINMPGGNNIKMVQEILNIQPNAKILIFSSYDEKLYALRYIQAGACGYINKNTSNDELIDALKTVRDRGRYMSEEVSSMYYDSLTLGKSNMQGENPLNKLSNREMDVAKQLILGHGILEIANELGLSTSTVSTYKSRIFDKLQVNNIADLIEKFRLYA